MAYPKGGQEHGSLTEKHQHRTSKPCRPTERSGNIKIDNHRREVGPVQAVAVGPVQVVVPTSQAELALAAPHLPDGAVAIPQRRRAVQPGGGAHNALPLPRRTDPDAVGARRDRLPRPHHSHGLPGRADRQMSTGMPVESPVRGDSHAGFGGRLGETERPKGRHRAPGRPLPRDQGAGRGPTRALERAALGRRQRRREGVQGRPLVAAKEPRGPHRPPGRNPRRPADRRRESPPRLGAQGNGPRDLQAQPDRRGHREADRPAARPPVPQPAGAVRTPRPHDPQTPRRDPRRPPPGVEQRPRRGAQQQGEADRPPRLRIPLRPRRTRAHPARLRPGDTYTATRPVRCVTSPTIIHGEPSLVLRSAIPSWLKIR